MDLQKQKWLLDSHQPVLVLGLGQTGSSLVRFFEQRQRRYLVFDDRIPFQAQSYGRAYRDEDVELLQMAFVSPGVPPHHPLVQQLTSRQVPIYSDLDLASWFLEGRFVGVTGTNGKSTTVRLIEHLLNQTGHSAKSYGNIGRPLIEAVDDSSVDIYVIEESSYQLARTRTLFHDVGVCLNIKPDHLDWHGDFDSYVEAKARLSHLVHDESVFIYNADDPACQKVARSSEGKAWGYSLGCSLGQGAWSLDQSFEIQTKSHSVQFSWPETSLYQLWSMRENTLAALLAVSSLVTKDYSWKNCVAELSRFQPLPHRLEKVAQVQGVTFYDDSKATNSAAAALALASFEGNIHWLAGGRSKNDDLNELKGLVTGKVKRAYFYGESCDKLFEVFSSVTQAQKSETLDQAFAAALTQIQEGDTVLLSPACASWDQFRNFEERGQAFQSLVRDFAGKAANKV